jgi:ABC-type multidrug transport system fused ATPase/permease subunit
MTTEREEPGQRNGQKLDDIVQDADEYYNYLKEKHVQQTRLDAIIVSLTVWLGAFIALGVGAYTTIHGSAVIEYILGAFLASIVIAVGAGLVTYLFRRRRAFKFAELGALVSKVKQGGASSEDGLHLMDAMHQAAFAVRKRRLTSAFEYGVLAFAIVTILGLNAGIGALAGVIVYLYFRYEALREYERGEERYENSKKALLQSL